ncbi:MAG: efflux RND transporter periplasmic adaptor subunit [Armatimonadetes bacterium]|nr:efflux RND transporter periplasmic adaptor subunit [Armatimonadota bacterium]
MKAWAPWAVVGIAVTAGFAWRLSAKASDSASLAKQQQTRKGAPAMVAVAVAGRQVIAQNLDLVGAVESPFVVKLSPKQQGKVTSINVREGDPVIPGEALVTIDPSQVDAQLLQQQSALSSAKSRLAQSAVAQTSNDVGIEAAIQQQRAQVTTSQADFDQAKATMKARERADQNQVVDAEAKLRSAESAVDSAKAGVDSANASLANYRVIAERQESLYGLGYVPLQDLQKAKTDVTVQENNVKAAEQSHAAAKSAVVSANAQLDAARQTALVNKRVLEAGLASAQAKLSQSRAALRSAGANSAQKQAYRENVKALRADVGAAQAQVRGVQSQLSDLVLRSTIEGIVTQRSADAGDLAVPGQPVVTIQYLKWLYVTASAPVDASPNIRPGQTVTIAFDAFPGQTVDARVDKVNPAADPQTHMFTFRVKLENPGQKYRPGMFAKVRIATSSTEAKVAVPREAVKNSTLFVLKQDGTVEQRTVKTGAEDDRFYEVLEGVKPGEQVVTLTYQPLRDGQKAQVGKPGGQR